MGIMKGKVWTSLAACFLALASGSNLPAQRAERTPPAGVPQAAKAEQLFAMANSFRAQEGRGRLVWDQPLADAAMKHCLLMAAGGPISHQYKGEADLSARSAEAGAHFSLIEENIAVGPYPASIHQGWLDSPGHRENLLNPEIDRVGIAVVAARGVLFAVADYAKGVRVMTQAQVEAHIASLLHAQGITVLRSNQDARAACRLEKGMPPVTGAASPQFIMRWQDANLDQLPDRLLTNFANGHYRQAEVGSCPARDARSAFTMYRVAVLLY
jgi:uncharacterized protein YkwD